MRGRRKKAEWIKKGLKKKEREAKEEEERMKMTMNIKSTISAEQGNIIRSQPVESVYNAMGTTTFTYEI